MKLACADFTWPLLEHERVLALIKLLDVEGVDLALFGNRSHIRPEVVRADIPRWADILSARLAHSGLELADFYFQPWTDFATMAPNHVDARQRDEASALFRDMLDLARRLGAPGITMLPGMRFGDEPEENAIARASEALKWRVEEAARVGLRLSVEGHIGSCVDTPAKLALLVDLTPGLTLTLDYTHFTAAGYADATIEPLLDHARHFHCRGAALGRLQTNFAENTIDYGRVVRRMQEIGYRGYFALEYVWSDWQDCNRSDNVCETILYRDFVRATLAGSQFTSRTTSTAESF
jgi:sugar phosphate isomerase/epimerase